MSVGGVALHDDVRRVAVCAGERRLFGFVEHVSAVAALDAADQIRDGSGDRIGLVDLGTGVDLLDCCSFCRHVYPPWKRASGAQKL